MALNTFNDCFDAQVFVYTNYGYFNTFAPDCGEGPGFDVFCFDGAANDDGDYVVVLMHGYMIRYFPNVSVTLCFGAFSLTLRFLFVAIFPSVRFN